MHLTCAFASLLNCLTFLNEIEPFLNSSRVGFCFSLRFVNDGHGKLQYIFFILYR